MYQAFEQVKKFPMRAFDLLGGATPISEFLEKKSK